MVVVLEGMDPDCDTYDWLLEVVPDPGGLVTVAGKHLPIVDKPPLPSVEGVGHLIRGYPLVLDPPSLHYGCLPADWVRTGHLDPLIVVVVPSAVAMVGVIQSGVAADTSRIRQKSLVVAHGPAMTASTSPVHPPSTKAASPSPNRTLSISSDMYTS